MEIGQGYGQYVYWWVKIATAYSLSSSTIIYIDISFWSVLQQKSVQINVACRQRHGDRKIWTNDFYSCAVRIYLSQIYPLILVPFPSHAIDVFLSYCVNFYSQMLRKTRKKLHKQMGNSSSYISFCFLRAASFHWGPSANSQENEKCKLCSEQKNFADKLSLAQSFFR